MTKELRLYLILDVSIPTDDNLVNMERTYDEIRRAINSVSGAHLHDPVRVNINVGSNGVAFTERPE